LPKKRGFPLWNPEANENLPGGVFPGVVGILDEFGGFDYLFTATLPADDQLNSGGVPPGFRELRINRSDINTLNDDPGSYIASNPAHIHKTILPGQSRIPEVPPEGGIRLQFTSTAATGALLVLPEGAQRIQHRQRSRFSEYALNHAQTWFTYANGPGLARGTQGLYFVTGCDKARAW
ncbi:hypothetical protein BT96DRAFT_795589, partial [Gymnopus androsaceus JB14]